MSDLDKNDKPLEEEQTKPVKSGGKIRMNFGVVKTVILAVILAGVLAVFGLDIAILAGAEGMTNNSPAIPAVSIVAGLIVGIGCVLLLTNSYYSFKENAFVMMLGIFGDKIRYEDILLVKQDIVTSELYLIVNDVTKGVQDSQIALKINISANKTAAFLKELRAHIPSVTVELFTKPKKKKKQD